MNNGGTLDQILIPPKYASPRKYENTDGPQIRQFIESFFVLQKSSFGGNAGDPIQLRRWQSVLIDDLFELRPDGTRRFRRGLIGLPKKNGKSFLGSALAIYALIGDGVHGAEVYSVAAATDQARIVFNEAKRFVESCPDLARHVKVYQKAMEFTKTGSVYRVLSADAGVQDGLNPSFVIFDEVHRQPNDELWTVMSQGIVTRPQAMLIGITTAGYDRQSLCYRLYDYGKKVATEELEDDAFFFNWWEPTDPDSNYANPDVWAQCNPGLGDFVSEDDIAGLCKGEPENQFRRYRLNQWTKTYSAWLKPGAWDELANEDADFLDDEEIVCGFDGSWSNDSTAFVAIGVSSHHIKVIEAWEKPPGEDDWRVDVADVEDAIKAFCDSHNVVEVACDPSFWKATLQHLADEGYPMVEIPNSPARMMPATKAFEDAVYEKRLSHSGDPRLARHIDNCVIKNDRRSDGYYISKDRKMSKEKIDIAVSAVLAFSRVAVMDDTQRGPSVIWIDEDNEDDRNFWNGQHDLF